MSAILDAILDRRPAERPGKANVIICFHLRRLDGSSDGLGDSVWFLTEGDAWKAAECAFARDPASDGPLGVRAWLKVAQVQAPEYSFTPLDVGFDLRMHPELPIVLPDDEVMVIRYMSPATNAPTLRVGDKQSCTEALRNARYTVSMLAYAARRAD